MLANSSCRNSDLANSGDNRIRLRVCAPDYARIPGLLEFFAREGTFASLFFLSNTSADRQEIVNVPSSPHFCPKNLTRLPPSPSPRSIGIFTLARNCKVILGAQSLAGKILMSKNLAAESQPSRDQCSFRAEVSASLMMAQLKSRVKVARHRGGCGKRQCPCGDSRARLSVGPVGPWAQRRPAPMGRKNTAHGASRG